MYKQHEWSSAMKLHWHRPASPVSDSHFAWLRLNRYGLLWEIVDMCVLHDSFKYYYLASISVCICLRDAADGPLVLMGFDLVMRFRQHRTFREHAKFCKKAIFISPEQSGNPKTIMTPTNVWYRAKKQLAQLTPSIVAMLSQCWRKSCGNIGPSILGTFICRYFQTFQQYCVVIRTALYFNQSPSVVTMVCLCCHDVVPIFVVTKLY